VHAEATALDLDGRKVTTAGGVFGYDYLVIATGYRNNFGVIPGLGPGGNAYTITTLDEAVKAGQGWRRFLRDPGDIVVGATQGAGCFGAAYEYLFNLSYQLRKAGLKRQTAVIQMCVHTDCAPRPRTRRTGSPVTSGPDGRRSGQSR
jgi:sulfide:quinone oxidoreductase